jgi:hypothetical protein
MCTLYERSVDDPSGEFRDPVNVGGAVAAAVIGGAALALILDLFINAAMPVPVFFFALLFPLAAVAAILIAFTTASLTYDRSGWVFTRKLFGHIREQEQGSWSQVVQTNYRQWFVSGGRSGGGTLYGELQVYDSSGRAVLRGRTAFFAQGNPTAGHSAGKRQIGLPVAEFDAFVRLIDRETPQLDYVWRKADVDPNASFGGLLAKPGPPHYLQVRRGEHGPDDPAIDDLSAEDEAPKPPTWRGQFPQT